MKLYYIVWLCVMAGGQGVATSSPWGVQQIHSTYDVQPKISLQTHHPRFPTSRDWSTYNKPASEPLKRNRKTEYLRAADRSEHRKLRKQKQQANVPYNKVKFHRRKSEYKPSLNDVDIMNPKELKTGVWRTYGRGMISIPKMGSNVTVPRTDGLKKAHKAMISTNYIQPSKQDTYYDDRPNRRSRRDCIGCPDDQMVVTRKGEAYVILPEPCPSMKWQPLSGPKPGMKLREGRHHLVGRLGHRRKICRFVYQVVVIHCKPLISPELDITCTADDAWGSKCEMYCHDYQQLVGKNTTECNDELVWSNPLPKCKKQSECLIPSSLTQETLHCSTGELISEDSEFLPEGSTCRYKCKTEENIIECQNGEWNKPVTCEEDEQFNEIEDKEEMNDEADDPCKPNPCLNGGTCLAGAHKEGLCLCPKYTTGDKCEYQRCTIQKCQNNGQCFVKDNIESCFCLPGYTGIECQQKPNRQRRHRHQHKK